MIATVTPNTALDRSLVVPGYAAGGVFRSKHAIAIPGGKGVNVARAVRILGGRPRCHGFVAGHTGALVAALAAQEGLDCHWTQLLQGETRVCTAFIDPERGMTTLVNESGVTTTPDDWSALRRHIQQTVEQSAPSAICFCGSLPPGAPLETFTDLLAALHQQKQAVWVDTSGAALKAASRLDGIRLKVNDDEAAELVGHALSDIADVAQAARTLAATSRVVVITLGKRGAVFSDGDGAWLAQPPDVEIQSAVGSGDSFLAGLLVALDEGKAPAEALRVASAAGTANALSVGAGHFTLDDYQRVHAGTEVSRLA